MCNNLNDDNKNIDPGEMNKYKTCKKILIMCAYRKKTNTNIHCELLNFRKAFLFTELL